MWDIFEFLEDISPLKIPKRKRPVLIQYYPLHEIF